MIHLTNIYPCAKIITLTEVYYIASIAKYLEVYNEQLSIEGVAIPKKFKNTDYYKYLATRNIVGVEKMDLAVLEEIKSNTMVIPNFTNKEVYFKSKEGQEWVFDYDDSGRVSTNNRFFKGLRSDQIYVDFMAYLTVEKIIKGTPQLLKMDFTRADIFLAGSYSRWDIVELWILYKRTKALDGWVDILLPEDILARNQLNYEAYSREKEQLYPNMNIATISEKVDYYKRNFKRGDIVLLYKKSEKGNKMDSIRTIESCVIAKIDRATTRGIELTTYNVNKSIQTIKRELSLLPEKLRSLYSVNYCKEYTVSKERFDWMDIGLDEISLIEQCFITDLNCNDTDLFLFLDKDGKEVELELNSADGIYALLDERGIEFDKERFENLYFSKTKSVYKQIILGKM